MMNAAGAPEAIIRLARQMRARGHVMEVCFLYEEAHLYRDEPYVRVLLPKERLSLLDYASLLFKVRREVTRLKPDIVIGFLPLGQVYGCLAGLSLSVRCRIASQRAPGPTYGTLARLLDKISGTLGVYTRIICVSEAVRESFASYPARYRRLLDVVHNGIEWPKEVPGRAASRQAFGLTEDQIVFVALGRLKPQKNYGHMIRVIADTPGVVLLIAGDGLQRKELRELAAELKCDDRVRFLGNLARPAVLQLLAAADAYIQTSTYEGQSNSTLEAMHAGLAIISSDISMQRETLCDEHGQATAILVPLDDLKGWRAGMAAVRDDPELRASLGAAARALVNRRFAVKKMSDRFEEIFLDQVADRCPL